MILPVSSSVDVAQIIIWNLGRVSQSELTLNTAGGNRRVEWEIDLRVPGIDKEVTSLVLPSTRDVLSLGKFIEEKGYSLEWSSGIRLCRGRPLVRVFTWM